MKHHAPLITAINILLSSCGGGQGAGDPCTPGAGDCSSGEYCNPQTSTCETTSDCTTHSDCNVAEHCASDNTCQLSVLGSPCETAEQCVLGQQCTAAGLCGCEGERFDAEQKEAEILVLLDRSGSMIYNGSPKWSQAKSAVNTMTGAYPEIDFGLLMYPDAVSNGCSLSEPQVGVGPDNAGTITTAMDGATASSNASTPILETLEQVEQNSYFVDPNKVHAVAFVTDGQQYCRDSNDAAGEAAGIAADIYAAGIKTFAIGFGTNADTDLLNAVAMAGGTGQYIDATDGAALTAELGAIAGSVSDCQYTLSADNITDMVVLVNNQEIPDDPANGYSFNAMTNEITFHGATCDMLQSASAPTDVVIATGCEAVVQ